ncbi:MAG: hypothetical protein KGQ77_13275, partial [Betaproteobacteria bacterium]|nr:hypothetical protein [Betaproteobacteria bacterium]
PDGLFRDGAHVQQPITRHIDALLRDYALPHVRITGQGDARLHNALQALRAVFSDASTASLRYTCTGKA